MWELPLCLDDDFTTIDILALRLLELGLACANLGCAFEEQKNNNTVGYGRKRWGLGLWQNAQEVRFPHRQPSVSEKHLDDVLAENASRPELLDAEL